MTRKNSFRKALCLLLALALIALVFGSPDAAQKSLNSQTSRHLDIDALHPQQIGLSDFELPAGENEGIIKAASLATTPLLGPSGDSIRTLRLAIATTGGYSAKFFGDATTDAQKRQNVSDELDRAVARLNEIFTVELGVRFELVPNNDELIFLDPATDDYLDNNNSADNDNNQVVVDRVIGSANYDIGHVFTAAGGGNAILGGVGDSRYKATGASGSSNSGTGDSFWMTVAHEMGHMFGAGHTYALNSGQCDTTASGLGSAVEPGSGTTIMSYAGLCGSSNNVQADNDPYFSAVSISQMRTYMAGTRFGNAGIVTPNSNSIPTISITPPVSSVVIPPQTPFILSASGYDANNGDSLTYVWDQADTVSTVSQLIGLSVEPKPAPVPLFRSRMSSSPSRYFPAMTSVLSNKTNQDALCSTLPTIAERVMCNSEYLPTTARTMDFRVTVRDGRGGVRSANVDVVVKDSTPFSVTSQNTSIAYPVNSTQTVTWNTAGSESWSPAFSTVDISTSIDGGNTWTLISDGTANDGSESIQIPSTVTSRFRVKIQPEGAVFYDVSNSNVNLYTPGVNGEPDAPTGVVAIASSDSNQSVVPYADVSWTAPVSEGATAVTSYTVTASPSSRTCTLAVFTSLTCRITNLTFGTAYTFTVVAVNNTGTSAPSGASQAVTPVTRPDPPTGVAAVASDASVALSWTPPTFDGGAAITEYDVWRGSTYVLTTTATSCRVTGLTNGTSYRFTVVANNPFFRSYSSTASTAVTPTSSATSTTTVSTTTTTTPTTTVSTTTTTPTTTTTVPTTTSSSTSTSTSTTLPLNIQSPTTSTTSTTPVSQSVVNLAGLSPISISKLTPGVVATLTPNDVAVLTSKQVSALKPKQISSLKTQSFAAFSVRQLKAIPLSAVTNVTRAQIKTLNATEVRALRLDKVIKKLSVKNQSEVRAALKRKK